jgi:hypothetical protein
MRGTVAKRLRRKHMGEGYSIRFAKYSTAPNTGLIHIGPRGRYRQAKKKYYQSRKRR